MNKIVASPEQAVADIPDGATVAIAGFGVAHRFATSLICALRDQGTKELTLVCNSLGDAGRDPRPDPRREQPGEEADRGVLRAAGHADRQRGADRRRQDGRGAGAPGHPGRALPRGRRRDPGVLLADRRRHRPRDGPGDPRLRRQAPRPRARDPRGLRPAERLSRRPSRQRPVPRRQPEFQSQLRQGRAGRDRRGGRDRGARRHRSRADRSARDLRLARRQDDAGRSTARPGAGPRDGPRTSRASTTASRR